ncbi:hypothetical protein FQR65_LT07247 [Abscondita terminalis]|nr:hypothetical protein FQR65_LT07247 [Abscondita terminalis]
MLGISLAIGIYFGFFGKKQNTADEYLKGGKQMSAVPIAISLIASQISTMTLLVVPAEIYLFGSNYVWLTLATVIECIIAYYIYFPVFFNLQVTSVFQYLELRFDKKLKILSSALVCYIFTGVDVHLVAGISSIICIFYTAVGGLKAVVWTDTLQFFIMVTTFLIIFLMGLSTIGGFKLMWKKSVEGERLDIIDFDPTLRDSFGGLIIGGTLQWLTLTGVHQGSVQKILSVSTFKEVKKVMPVYTTGMVLMHIFATLFGLLLYARYWNCDPISTKEITRLEQLVPQFVMEVAGGYPGLPVYTALMAVSLGPILGIFTLGMLVPKANSNGTFFAALVSSVIIAWIAVQNQKYQSIIYEEFMKPISADGCNATVQVGLNSTVQTAISIKNGKDILPIEDNCLEEERSEW